MDILAKRPNILFLIAVRDKDLYFKLLITRIRELYIKVNKALTFYESNIYGEHWYIKSYVRNGPYYDNKCVRWYVMGIYHRIDGPAFKNIDLEVWRHNGKLYREDGPAIIRKISKEYPGGTNHEYWINGKQHREDGPAVIAHISKKYPDGTYHEYWINGERQIKDKIDF